MSKAKIVDEIHRAARRNFPRRHVILKGIDDLWQADLIDIQKFSRENNGYKYILVAIDGLSKFGWAVPIKTKSKVDVTLAFNKILKLGRYPNHLQTDMGKEFYNDQFKNLLKDYGINHYSTFSVKKASIVERFIKTIKNKLYKHFSIAGNYKWIKKPLNEILNTYNNQIHRTIGLKPIEINKQNESLALNNINKSRKHFLMKNKFQVGDHVRISKYKGSFAKGYTPNWSSEVFIVRQVIRSYPVTYFLKDRKGNLIQGCFYEQELLKTNYPDIYLIEKVIKRNGSKLFVKWFGLSQTENSWIDKKELV